MSTMTRSIATTFVILAAGASTAWSQPSCQIDYGRMVGLRLAPDPPVHQGPVGSAAHFGSHGQLVFGVERVHLHHLPFLLTNPSRHPHNFQVVMRVSFVDEADALVYRERRGAAPEALFTALPPAYNQDQLEEVFDTGLEGQTLGMVEFFDQHFENVPQPAPFLVAEMVVDEVLAFRELQPTGATAEELHYRIVDAESETFLVHDVSSPPDFDQVLRVTLTPELGAPSSPVFDRGWLRLIGATNTELGRLAPGDTLICEAHDGTRRLPFDVTVEVVRETYCEAGELSDVAGGPSFEGKRACQ